MLLLLKEDMEAPKDTISYKQKKKKKIFFKRMELIHSYVTGWL